MDHAGIRAEAVVDLDAVRANVGALLARAREANPAAELMAVVKADAYGHGAVPVARAALAGGARMLGLATPEEAVALRTAGIAAPLLAWLWTSDQDIGPALDAGVELGVSSTAHLHAVLRTGKPARIQLKLDTGLGRNGCLPTDLGALATGAGAAQRSGQVEITGVMSHFARADEPGDPSIDEQLRLFRQLLSQLTEYDIRPRWRHMANTPAVMTRPDTVFDLVRCGIGVYGVDPLTVPADIDLRPAMTLRARVALVKRVPAGHGVSYGLTYRTSRETTLALVPLGYADGIPRAASNVAEVLLHGRRRRIAGRVAMDQFVLDCGDDEIAAGDEVLVFGPGNSGEPTANEFGQWCGTIGYEIVTRIGPRVPRRYIGGPNGEDAFS